LSAALPPGAADSVPIASSAGRHHQSLLEVSGLNSYYGDSHILFDVSLRVERNEVVALLGRNGAGKSTTLKSLMGVVTPRAGSVRLDGVEIAGRKSHAIAKAAQACSLDSHSCGFRRCATPGGGAIRTFGRPGGAHWTPTLAAFTAALPPVGALFAPWGGPAVLI